MLEVDMQFISKLNKGCRFLLCVIDIYRYLYLKDKKAITVTNPFQIFLMNLIANQSKYE